MTQTQHTLRSSPLVVNDQFYRSWLQEMRCLIAFRTRETPWKSATQNISIFVFFKYGQSEASKKTDIAKNHWHKVCKLLDRADMSWFGLLHSHFRREQLSWRQSKKQLPCPSVPNVFQEKPTRQDNQCSNKKPSTHILQPPGKFRTCLHMHCEQIFIPACVSKERSEKSQYNDTSIGVGFAGRAGLGWALWLSVYGLHCTFSLHVCMMSLSLCVYLRVYLRCVSWGLSKTKPGIGEWKVVLSNSVLEKCDVKRTKWKQKERNGSSGNQRSLKRTA